MRPLHERARDALAGAQTFDIAQGTASRLLRRPRRLRASPALRALVRETRLTTDDLILPIFITHEPDVAREVPSMPGVFQFSVQRAAAQAEAAATLGLRAVILFGLPELKDAQGSGAFVDDGVVQRALREIRERCPDIVAIADTCLCEYTEHGHCGVLDPRLEVDNDATLDILQRVALSHAEAGADIVAPSGMIDGMVGAIRAGSMARASTISPILVLLDEIRVGLLWAVPRGGAGRAHIRRPAHAPDGPRQCARSAARDRAGCGARAPTCSWSSRRWPISTSSARCAITFPICRWRPTT